MSLFFVELCFLEVPLKFTVNDSFSKLFPKVLFIVYLEVERFSCSKLILGYFYGITVMIVGMIGASLFLFIFRGMRSENV